MRVVLSERVVQLASAVAAVVLAILLAAVSVAVFVIASVPALVAGGRWLKSFGAGGVIADEAADLRGALGATERELERRTRNLEVVTKERDEAVALVDQLRSNF